MKRACIFVDGENFRHSLINLFQNGRYTFRKHDYLPETDWHQFFNHIASRFECNLLRTYWYVVEHVDCRPYRIPTEWLGKEKVLAGDADYLPPVAAVKRKGRRVHSVSFLDQKGRQLPGEARRLSNAVDSRTDLDFETVRKLFGIEQILAAADDSK